MRLFLALGPGDIVSAEKERSQSRPASQSDSSIGFSTQILELCRSHRIPTLAVSSNQRADAVQTGNIRIENRPRWGESSTTVFFHLSRLAYALYLAFRARRFGADLAIVDSGTTHYFALFAMRALRIRVAINFHNVLWPSGFEPVRGKPRVIKVLDGLFFRFGAAGAVGVSPECKLQFLALARRSLPFFEYRAQYRKDGFDASRPSRANSPFIIMFAGRAEISKGLLDLPQIALHLERTGNADFAFEVCGDGPALNELKKEVILRNLNDKFYIRGRLDREELLLKYKDADAVVVPTRSTFCEGLPQVCAEAVISGVPIVTSRLSNAFPVLDKALCKAEPDDPESYARAISKLMRDEDYLQSLRRSCAELTRQFFDRNFSYPAAVDRLLAALFRHWQPLSNYQNIFARLNGGSENGNLIDRRNDRSTPQCIG